MIEILNYERANKNKVIGYLDVKVNLNGLAMIIRRISHLQSGDRKWFNLPTYSKDKPDGSRQYFKYWQFETEAHNGQFLETLTEKVKEFCQKNNIEEIAPLNFDIQTTKNEELPF